MEVMELNESSETPRLYYVSDTHHELLKPRMSDQVNVISELSELSELGADNVVNYLALCGDIGCPFQDNYEAFLRRHSERFDHVFVVSGNHEYYTSKKKQRTVEQTDEKIREITAGLHNVTFLQQTAIVIRGITFIGCTLWAAVDDEAASYMNDYRRIFVDFAGRERDELIWAGSGTARQRLYLRAGRVPLKPSHVRDIHQRHRAWLTDTINRAQSEGTGKVVVLTHHAPSMSMLRPNTPSMLASISEPIVRRCYASECDELFAPPVVAWVSGHTHRCTEVAINGIPSVSNCYGYPSETTGVIMDKWLPL